MKCFAADDQDRPTETKHDEKIPIKGVFIETASMDLRAAECGRCAAAYFACMPSPFGSAPANAVTQWSSKTATGVVLEVVVPSPRFPNALLPQHFTVPEFIRAQACLDPTDREVTPELSPVV